MVATVEKSLPKFNTYVPVQTLVLIGLTKRISIVLYTISYELTIVINLAFAIFLI